jgi:DNA-binding NarL/FixJ family response regulator
MRIYTVFILEDSFWDLSALTKILESIDNIQIIGTAETVPEAIAECTAKKPDLIIVDAKIGYDKSAGEKFVRYIRNQQPDIRILGLSYHIDLLPGLKLAGCHYVEHKALIEDREAARKFIQGALTPKPVKYREEAPPTLSTIEDRVLKLISEGYTEAEIAKELGYPSAKSVKKLKQSLYNIFGAKNAPQLVNLAYKTGYLNPDTD